MGLWLILALLTPLYATILVDYTPNLCEAVSLWRQTCACCCPLNSHNGAVGHDPANDNQVDYQWHYRWSSCISVE